jgi:hypothetical protein
MTRKPELGSGDFAESMPFRETQPQPYSLRWRPVEKVAARRKPSGLSATFHAKAGGSRHSATVIWLFQPPSGGPPSPAKKRIRVRFLTDLVKLAAHTRVATGYTTLPPTSTYLPPMVNFRPASGTRSLPCLVPDPGIVHVHLTSPIRIRIALALPGRVQAHRTLLLR